MVLPGGSPGVPGREMREGSGSRVGKQSDAIALAPGTCYVSTELFVRDGGRPVLLASRAASSWFGAGPSSGRGGAEKGGGVVKDDDGASPEARKPRGSRAVR